MAAIARLCTSSPLLSQLDALFSAYSLGRLYWQSSQCEDNTSLREALTLYKYDSAGSRMFEELAAGSDRFYATLPRQPLTVQPECPVTLKDVSDL